MPLLAGRDLGELLLNHDLFTVDDEDTALGLGLVYALAVEVVDDGILQVCTLGSLPASMPVTISL